MSEAPETINNYREMVDRYNRAASVDLRAANESLRQRVEALERTLRQIKQGACFMTAHQIETMARDALEGK